jgi:hypothetical protein
MNGGWMMDETSMKNILGFFFPFSPPKIIIFIDKRWCSYYIEHEFVSKKDNN